jgi:hypothetical protein
MPRKSPRTRRIYRAGEEAYQASKASGDLRLLQAMAAMIAEATKKPARKKQDAPKLPFSTKEFYELVLRRVSHIVACEPYNKRWFGALGKKMQDTNGLEREDMERMVQWIEGGGLAFGSDWTFDHVIKHWSTWLVKARSANQSSADSAQNMMEAME